MIYPYLKGKDINSETVNRRILDCIFYSLFIEYASHYSGVDDDIPLAPGIKSAIDNYIDNNISNIDIDIMSNTLGINSREVAGRSKVTFGQTFHQYVISKRLDKAAEILKNSDIDIIELSLMLGFCSQSHFSVMFSRRFGMPPGRFRKMFKFRMPNSK